MVSGLYLYIIPAIALLLIVFSFFVFQTDIAVSLVKGGTGPPDSRDQSVEHDTRSEGGDEETLKTTTDARKAGRTRSECEAFFAGLRKVESCASLSVEECGTAEEPKAYEQSDDTTFYRKCFLMDERLDTDEDGEIMVEALETPTTVVGGDVRPVEAEGKVATIRVRANTKEPRCSTGVVVNCNLLK